MHHLHKKLKRNCAKVPPVTAEMAWFAAGPMIKIVAGALLFLAGVYWASERWL